MRAKPGTSFDMCQTRNDFARVKGQQMRLMLVAWAHDNFVYQTGTNGGFSPHREQTQRLIDMHGMCPRSH